MLSKTRSVSADWGKIATDGRYYNYVAEANNTSSYLHNESWCRTKFNLNLGANFRSAVSFSGNEKISWTNRGYGSFNNCDHIKEKSCSYLFFFAWINSAYYKRLMWYQRYRMNITSATLYENRHLTDDIGFARNRAWWNMQPRFEGEVSMLNFLFELKDFKQVAKHLFKPSRISLINKLRDKMARSVKDPTLPAAEALLTYNFAIKPLIADVMEIIAQAQVIVSEVQKEFEGRGLDFQRSHYTEELARSDSFVTPSSTYFYWTTGKKHRTSYTATLEYKYRYTPRAAKEAFLQYWGLNPSFEALWNALPFSFVADYFAAIGKSIHAMSVDPNVSCNYRDYCESLVSTLDSGGFITPDARLGGLIIDGVWFDTSTDYRLVAGISKKIYRRYTCSPSYGPALPKLKAPSSTQLLNLTALARCLY